ncbi:hypothetical protein DOTSEDRAFT_36053 [Dothistroma septosporum NZE10]|uniref:F-box domain-containing protein n=1 Tax=Dothistroma septosporum (strain NZE10 / CBS 128990) TaxID=675120 RepID=N1PHN7_DOTSN|nr:hypothetical protein DOTSEDRAFT_36053 [Dothistroma septosporum NZE10]
MDSKSCRTPTGSLIDYPLGCDGALRTYTVGWVTWALVSKPPQSRTNNTPSSRNATPSSRLVHGNAAAATTPAAAVQNRALWATAPNVVSTMVTTVAGTDGSNTAATSLNPTVAAGSGGSSGSHAKGSGSNWASGQANSGSTSSSSAVAVPQVADRAGSLGGAGFGGVVLAVSGLGCSHMRLWRSPNAGANASFPVASHSIAPLPFPLHENNRFKVTITNLEMRHRPELPVEIVGEICGNLDSAAFQNLRLICRELAAKTHEHFTHQHLSTVRVNLEEVKSMIENAASLI